tara:strand:- start:25 stop:261 length:237 start_codon:yes stop_codon:yes gene_type:complete
VFNVGDLVRWSVDLVTLRPLENSAQAEALGIVRKINATDIEMKILNANEAGKEYLNALKDLSAWEKLPVHTADCEVVA